MEEIIAFGGIMDPVTAGRRVINRIQDQPDADDLQIGCAMRAAKLRDVEATACTSFNKSSSIMHFSANEIINKAHK